MKRARDDSELTLSLDLDMARCLMFLSHNIYTAIPQRSNNNQDDNINVFECKTCRRRFSSFQALGGHRASHKRPRSSPDTKAEDQVELSLGCPIVKPTKMHECSICGHKFANGQALGGHMRKHRDYVISESATMNLNSVITLPVLKRSNSSKRVMSLDLNLTPLENDIEFMFGTKTGVLRTQAMIM